MKNHFEIPPFFLTNTDYSESFSVPDFQIWDIKMSMNSGPLSFTTIIICTKQIYIHVNAMNRLTW